MTKALDIITGALKDLGLLEQAEAASGAEASDALTVLNQMLNSWIYEGIDLEYESLSSPQDNLNYPEDHMGTFRTNLAVRLAPQYGVIPSPVIVAMAADGVKQLQREYADPDILGTDDQLKPRFNPNGYYTDSSLF